MTSRIDRTRMQILAAANTVFGELGIAETSMEQIAQRAGLTRKTLYNRFGAKDDIVRALIAEAEANDQPYRLRMDAGVPALELLLQVFSDSAGWCRANPALAREALSPAIRPALDPPEGRPSFHRLVLDLVTLGQAQGVLRRDEDARTIALMLLAIHGQAMLNLLSGASADQTDTASIIRLMVEGVGPQDR